MIATKRSVDVLLDDEDNARYISDEAIEGLGRSMVKLGDLSGIVWNRRNGKLVCGHQRMDRLRASGTVEWTEVDEHSGFIVHPKTGERFPIRIVDWEDATARMANIVANNPELQGTFTENLQDQLQELEEQTAFEELRLRELMAGEEPAARERRALEEFETAPPPKRAWIMIATTEDLAPEIEAELREKYDGQRGTRIEVSIGAR